MKVLTWNDSTDEEKIQVKESYLSIREIEEDRQRKYLIRKYYVIHQT